MGLPKWLSGKETRLPMQEMQVRSLGGEDPLEEEMATCLENPMNRGAWRAALLKRVEHDLETQQQMFK